MPRRNRKTNAHIPTGGIREKSWRYNKIIDGSYAIFRFNETELERSENVKIFERKFSLTCKPFWREGDLTVTGREESLICRIVNCAQVAFLDNKSVMCVCDCLVRTFDVLNVHFLTYNFCICLRNVARLRSLITFRRIQLSVLTC